MIEPIISAQTATALGKYLVQWLRGLMRASEQRKRDCEHAIDSVIAGVRRTQAYCRARDKGQINAETEASLAAMWTELGFQLEALGVKKLAKRCDVSGRYWASPEQFSKEWLDQADIGFDSVEKLARQLKAHIKVNGAP